MYLCIMHNKNHVIKKLYKVLYQPQHIDVLFAKMADVAVTGYFSCSMLEEQDFEKVKWLVAELRQHIEHEQNKDVVVTALFELVDEIYKQHFDDRLQAITKLLKKGQQKQTNIPGYI